MRDKSKLLRQLLIALTCLCASPLQAEEPPQRIVSTNLCTDQILMQLVAPERIVSVSYLAADPVSSNMAEQAKAIGLNRASAEQIIVSAPDLILAGSFSASHTSHILETLGYRVERFSPATDLSSAKANISRIGALVGEPNRAKAMVDQIDSAVAKAQALVKPQDAELTYANYALNGYTSGDGTLMADLIEMAGFITLASKMGLNGMPQLSAEHLIVARPDVIELSANDYAAPSRSTEALQHPALLHLLAHSESVSIPAAQTACGTTHALQALETLSSKRADILNRRQGDDS